VGGRADRRHHGVRSRIDGAPPGDILADSGLVPEKSNIPAHRATLLVTMQAHDRMTQQLCHVAEALRSLADADPAATDWTALRRQQLCTFSMREERVLFSRMVPDAHGDHHGIDHDANDADSIELFE
jgi:hypothetical protein